MMLYLFWPLIEGLYHVVSKLGKLLWVLIVNSWPVLLAGAALLAKLGDRIDAAAEKFAQQIPVAWNLLRDSKGGVSAAIAAGWPPGAANALGHVNQYFPLWETVSYLGILVTTFIVMSLIRVVKSFIPTISG